MKTFNSNFIGLGFGSPLWLPWRSKNQALEFDNLTSALFSFLPTYAEFCTLFLDKFKWKFPVENEQLSSDFCELLQLYRGRCAVVDSGDNGFILCDFNPVERYYNMFGGYPRKIQAIDIFNNDKVIGTFDEDKFVIIPNNKLWYPTNITIMKYSLDIANLIDAMDLNTEAQKFPVVLQGTPEQKLMLKQLADKIECGDKYLFLDKAYNIDDIKTLFINAPFISKELDDLKERKRAELLTKLGINNANVLKESGINQYETNANNSLVELNNKALLTPRLESIEQIKEKFGLDVELEYQTSYTKPENDFTITEESEDNDNVTV